MRDRRLRARRLRRLRDPAACGARAGRDRGLRRRRRSRRRVEAAGGGDPAAADALGERRPLRADVVPRAGRTRGGAAARPGAARAQRLRPLPADRGGSSSATSPSCASAAAGTRASCWGASSGSPPSRAASRSAATASSGTCSSPPGHPGLAVPDELAGDPRVVHAYEPHEYASRVTVVGAGMAAATEWLNALAAGSEVVSIRRREPARRPLNVARPFFTKRGLAAFYAAPRTRRAELLRGFGEPSYPPGRSWDAPIEARRARGPLPRGGGGERRRAGDLRDRLPRRLPSAIRCWRGSSTSTSSRRRAAGSCSRTTRAFRA